MTAQNDTVDLELSPADRAFRAELRAWLRRQLPRRWRGRPHGQEPQADEPLAELRAWQRALHRAGYLGIGWPTEYGGHTGSSWRQTIVNEELAKRAPGIVGLLGVAMVAPTLLRFGSEAQKQRFIPKILSAEELWCQGYSEPEAGSDLASLRTRAEPDGDALVVTGQKIWTSNAHLCEWMFALVRSDPEAPRHRGLSYLLIPLAIPGVRIVPIRQMTGEPRLHQVFFDGARVPLENVVGGLGRGWEVANATLEQERDLLGSASHAESLFVALLRLARRTRRGGGPAPGDRPRTRRGMASAEGARSEAKPSVVAGGPGPPRGRDPLADALLRDRLAALEIRVEALRLHAWRMQSLALAGRPLGIGPNVTKLATTWLNHEIAELALELLGPSAALARGPRDEAFWSHELMFSLGMIIGGGTSQIQRNVIAQRGLGLPRGA